MLPLVVSVCALLLAALPGLRALDNGLAMTPPMGWLSWERFRCDIDCVNDPDNCISEKLYMQMADHLAADGYSAVGYNYVNIDDCWAEKMRDFQTGQLVADHTRFPSGIRALADYVHNKTLMLGIYGDFGMYTCGGYPGTLGYIDIDAKTFANWTVDSLKLDGCYANIELYTQGYPNMSLALNATGRPILYACSWPAYYQSSGKFNDTDWHRISQYCNYWRNYNDINDDWASVSDIIEWWGAVQDVYAPLTGPGHWNDPDMILCGDFALSIYECRAQFALWSLWSAPLFLSVDLRNIDSASKAVITNKDVIAIDQDPLGQQGRRVQQWNCNNAGKMCEQQLWAKNLSNGDLAVVLYNRESYGMPVNMTASWSAIGAPAGSKWQVTDLYAGKVLGSFADNFNAMVNTHEAKIYRLVRAKSDVADKPAKRARAAAKY